MPYTQNRNLGILGHFFFTSNFERSCILDAKMTNNLPRQKLKGHDLLLLKKLIFLIKADRDLFLKKFCPIPKIENSEISESVPLLQIVTFVVI